MSLFHSFRNLSSFLPVFCEHQRSDIFSRFLTRFLDYQVQVILSLNFFINEIIFHKVKYIFCFSCNVFICYNSLVQEHLPNNFKFKALCTNAMKFNNVCLLLLCYYTLTAPACTEGIWIENSYVPNNPSIDLQQPKNFLDSIRNKIMQQKHNQNNYYDSYIRGKRPFYTQPIPNPVFVTPFKRMPTPIKRIICYRGNRSNCKFLFTFLNRS